VDKSAELLNENPRDSVQENSTSLTITIIHQLSTCINYEKPCATDRSISFMEISELYGVSNPLKSPDVRRISLKTIL
jgi:hypothetical protein